MTMVTSMMTPIEIVIHDRDGSDDGEQEGSCCTITMRTMMPTAAVSMLKKSLNQMFGFFRNWLEEILEALGITQMAKENSL